MKIQRAYKTELNPNDVQRAAFLQHAGAARWVYNWGLAEKKAAFEAGGKTPGASQLDSKLRNGEIEQVAPWLREINSHTRQEALRQLDAAYKNFFRRLKAGKLGRSAGFPKFKSRKNGIGSFTVFSYSVRDNAVRLPKIGWVRLHESGYIPEGGYGKNTDTVRFYGARISERAGRWFISVMVEEEMPDPLPSNRPVAGVHFGARVLATYSGGITFNNPKPLQSQLKKLKRLQRNLSRKKPDSNNREKARRRIATLHYRIASKRTHTQHHISHVVTRKSSVIGMEKWDIQRMMSESDDARFVARALSDAGIAEIQRQVSYKSAWRGRKVVIAPQAFPSSRTCSACGVIHDKAISGYSWACRSCGTLHDREQNSANNLRKLAASHADSLNASGESGAGSQ